MYLVLSTSLNRKSRSRVMARLTAQRLLAISTRPVDFLDLQDLDLPFCDGGDCFREESVARLTEKVAAARGIVIATPVYNYDVSAAAKNVVELTGQAWADTVVAFVCAAGGRGSYMAPMAMASSLMLDFRSFIVPRFVFATGKAFDEENRLIDSDVQERLGRLANDLTRVTEALQSG